MTTMMTMKTAELVNGLPIWIKIISVVGFPIAVAVFFMAQNAGMLPSPTARLLQILERRTEQFDRHVKTTDDLTIGLRRAMKIMCENAAKDDADRRRCGAIE